MISLSNGPSVHVVVTFSAQAVELITLQPTQHGSLSYEFNGGTAALQAAVSQWLIMYAQGMQPTIQIPLSKSNLAKTSQVLDRVSALPFGSTCSYGNLAQHTGSPKGARAIGRICAANKFPLVIPCHRVISKSGSLCGYAFGLSLKKALLEFESKTV